MIAYLKGVLISKSPISVTVDVNGVGYEVFVPLSTFYELPDTGNSISFRIHTQHKEDTLKLFGFLTEEDKKIFEILISINKVGPKMALTILSGMSTSALLNAVNNNDVDRLSTIPGVGRKTSERLILELKDKLKNIETTEDRTSSSSTNGTMEDALSALINLGYKKPQAEMALKKVTSDSDSTTDLEYLIKESLNILS
ncbi:MAG: Holliday junction branch migration protein RuvA [Nitrospinales bacterium]